MNISHDGLRLLGIGVLAARQPFHAHHATASAIAKIRAAGGKVQTV